MSINSNYVNLNKFQMLKTNSGKTLTISSDLLVALDITSNMISIIGSLFIIIIYFLNRKDKLSSYAFKIIIYLTFADLIFSISQVMNFDIAIDNISNPAQCQIQAFLSTYGGLSSILWTTVISYTMKKTIFEGENENLLNEKYFLLYGYGIPLVIASLPFTTNDYGLSGVICWVDDDGNTTATIWRMVCFYIPLWIAIIFNLFTYYKVVKYLKSISDQDQKEFQTIKKLQFYPFILIICWIWGTINRIYVSFGDEVEWLSAIHLFMGGLMGFFNAIVYGFNYQIKQIIQQQYCKCCFRQRTDSQERTRSIELNTQFDVNNSNNLNINNDSQLSSRNMSQNVSKVSDKNLYADEGLTTIDI